MEKNYTAPKAPHIVEPERMAPKVPKIPKWIKKSPIPPLIILYSLLNIASFFGTTFYRNEGLSKSKIEERIDYYVEDTVLIKLVIDDFSKPGRGLAYLVFGDGEEEK